MMKTNNKFLVRMDLSIMPKDIINCIGRHLIDFPVLEKEQLKKYDRKSIYLLYFFYNYLKILYSFLISYLNDWNR